MNAGTLLRAAKRALMVIEEDYQGLLDSHCLHDDEGQPRRDTIEPGAEAAVREYEEVIAELEAAIARVEARVGA